MDKCRIRVNWMMKTAFTNVASIGLFQVASNIVEIIKYYMISYLSAYNRETPCLKFVLNIVLFSIISLVLLIILDIYNQIDPSY